LIYYNNMLRMLYLAPLKIFIRHTLKLNIYTWLLNLICLGCVVWMLYDTILY